MARISGQPQVHRRLRACGGRWWQRLRALALAIGLGAVGMPGAPLMAQEIPPAFQRGDLVRLDSLRFTVLAAPADIVLGRALLHEAIARDTFPGLPRSHDRVLIAIAPTAARFREWVGPEAPEWGTAIAFPSIRRIVMRGSRATGRGGDPLVTLRHELAHLALHETLGTLPPRWFDEGYASYAAAEWGREEVLATNLALVLRGVPALDSLDALFQHGESRAQQGYALAQQAVAELAALDPVRGLALFFVYWRSDLSFDRALRHAYGITTEAFEVRWKTVIRRRYGALALVADVSLATVLLLTLVGPLWLLQRRRDRRRLAILRTADEVDERAAAESALAALLGEADRPEDFPPAAGAGPEDDSLGMPGNGMPNDPIN